MGRSRLIAALVLVPCVALAQFKTDGLWKTDGLLQIAGYAGSGYTWSLGDLAPYASRFDVTWDNGSWADPYDTAAELAALPGVDAWEVYDIPQLPTSPGVNCADGGSGSDEDRTAMQQIMDNKCAANECRNGSRGGVIFRIPASCKIDVMSGRTGAFVDRSYGLLADSSHAAYVGVDQDTSHIGCNIAWGTGTYDANNNQQPNPCFVNSSEDPINPTTGSTWTWVSGTSRGAGSVGTPIDLDEATACTTLAAGDRLRLTGTGVDGEALTFNSRIESVNTSTCEVVLLTPLAIAVTTPVNAVEIAAANTTMTLISNLKISYPYIPDGTCSTDACSNSINALVRWHQGDDFIVDSARIGPYAMGAIDVAGSFRATFRHNVFGDGQMAKRRGTRGGVITNNRNGSSYSIFDNVLLAGAKRIATVANYTAIGHWTGFNYLIPQTATVSGETGNHCDGVGFPANYPHAGFGPSVERSMFLNHDGPVAGVGAYLIEANDLECQANNEGGSIARPRYATVYRHRSNRTNGNYVVYNALEQGYFNFIANRFGDSMMTSTPSRHTNALGLWNVVESSTSIGTPGSGSTWPTTGTGKNYSSETGPHDDYAISPPDLPPSLALQQDTAPDWWCQESGPWDGTWTFAYADGHAGNSYRLPAQIRYEGTTCTPP